MAKEMKKHAGHGYDHTEIIHHTDGSHSVTHHVHPDHAHEMKDMSYAKGDLDGVHDGLEDHMGEPNEGEGLDEEGLEEKIHPGIHHEVIEEANRG